MYKRKPYWSPEHQVKRHTKILKKPTARGVDRQSQPGKGGIRTSFARCASASEDQKMNQKRRKEENHRMGHPLQEKGGRATLT